MRRADEVAAWLEAAVNAARANDEEGMLEQIEQALIAALPEIPQPGALLIQATADGVALAEVQDRHR